MSAILRRFRFGLRTLFVVTTLVAAWLSYSLSLMRQREALRNELRFDWEGHPSMRTPLAPSGLWLLGERGYDQIYAYPKDFERIKRLFPEARTWNCFTADLDMPFPTTPWNPEGQMSGPDISTLVPRGKTN